MPLLNRLRTRILKPKIVKKPDENYSSKSDFRDEKSLPKKGTGAGSIVKTYFKTATAAGKNKIGDIGNRNGKPSKKSNKLARSDTFTINDQQSGTGGNSINKNSNDALTRSRVAAIKTDVFETLYSKRPSKSSRSSKSSIESQSGIIEHIEDLTKPILFDSSTYRKPRSKYNEQLGNSSPNRTVLNIRNNLPKPREYLFGTSERIAQQQSPVGYLTNDADRNQYFLSDIRSSSDVDSLINKYNQLQNEPILINKPSISRKNTFKIDGNSSKTVDGRTQVSVRRSSTFKIDKDDSVKPIQLYCPDLTTIDRRKTTVMEPIRVEIQNSTLERVGKIVPVGVTAPYSALNDVRENYSVNIINDKINLELNNRLSGDSTRSSGGYSTRCLIKIKPNEEEKVKFENLKNQQMTSQINGRTNNSKPTKNVATARNKSFNPRTDWSYNQVHL